jgi:polyisoprenyl-phosphate glycosyltransferase
VTSPVSPAVVDTDTRDGVLSLVIPVYNNRENLPRLLRELETFAALLPARLEVVFVVDGATDGSLEYLQTHLPEWSVSSRLVELSRNFGSFPAITAGLQHASGQYMVVMAADLQEPPALALEFHRILSADEADVVFGVRSARSDPWWSRWMSNGFWRLYRRLVVRDMPRGGVDVFGCTRQVSARLAELREAHTSLVALVFWVGFRRRFVAYDRQPRLEGRSGWTFGRKLRYAIDSVFSFTDLPIRALMLLGVIGTTVAMTAGVSVFVMWMLGRIPVLGYTPLMLVITFFGGLTALGFGITGQYLWLALQNARQRPPFIVRSSTAFEAEAQVRTTDRNSS